jgi:hypothetical protein
MLDHLVYAAPDLDAAVDDLAERVGVRAARGGKHPGLGTHNALLALDKGTYLEVIASDPSQAPTGPRPFGVDTLTEPRLVTWAVKAPDIESRVERARADGYDPGNIIELSRELPDGGQLRWRLTFAAEPAGAGLIPFLIDWGSAAHPSQGAPRGCCLLSLRAEHPQPELVRPSLQALAVDLAVTKGPRAALIATLQTASDQVEIR